MKNTLAMGLISLSITAATASDLSYSETPKAHGFKNLSTFLIKKMPMQKTFFEFSHDFESKVADPVSDKHAAVREAIYRYCDHVRINHPHLVHTTRVYLENRIPHILDLVATYQEQNSV